jgi:nucleotide-binding universal stress UspA family protein
MVRVDGSQTRHLTLDSLHVNPRLARRLSPAVACRYHALPVAEDGGHITVAMANPNDAVAREAVLTALGAPSCVVEGNATTIDALLAQVWPEVLQRSLSLLVYTPASPAASEVLAFARYTAGLLEARLSHYRPTGEKDVNCDGVARVAEQGGYDLVVWGEADRDLGRRLILGLTCNRARKRMNASLLAAWLPRWPFKRLLLLLQGEERDDAALDWAVRLARPSGASVTALAVIAPLPAVYGQCTRMQQGLDAVLATQTPLGQQMRRAARWLVDWEVQATLLLRQGLPDQKIRREVVQGEYDLIVVADQPGAWWRRCLSGDWVASLPGWAGRPVLIAKPFRGTRDCASRGNDQSQKVDAERFLEVNHV